MIVWIGFKFYFEFPTCFDVWVLSKPCIEKKRDLAFWGICANARERNESYRNGKIQQCLPREDQSSWDWTVYARSELKLWWKLVSKWTGPTRAGSVFVHASCSPLVPASSPIAEADEESLQGRKNAYVTSCWQNSADLMCSFVFMEALCASTTIRAL